MLPSSRVITVGGGLVAALGLLLLVVGSLSTAAESPLAQQPAATPGAAPATSPAATATPLSLQTLSQIQPGLSTYMLEAAQRLGVMWFAAKQNNWDLAAFEGREIEGVLQHGAVRSNVSRQQGIAAFNTALLEPLIKAAQAGDPTKFEASYRTVVLGCNGCHAAQTYGAINKPFSFIKIQVPTNSPEDVYAYTP